LPGGGRAKGVFSRNQPKARPNAAANETEKKRGRDDVHCEVWERFWRLKESVDAGDLDAVREQMESLESIREWLMLDRFDRRAINRRLKQDVEMD
jgi:hypothetical protein